MNSKNVAVTSGKQQANTTDISHIKISGGLIARNTLLNLIGKSLPLIVGVFTIPYVVHGLGTDRFGLLSLAWVVLGYSVIFDLGLGRATTKYVAEAWGKAEGDRVPQIIWTSVSFQVILGLVGSIVLFGITDLLVERVLNITPILLDESKSIFHMIALSVPLVLVSSSFRGVMEAAQRFDLVNAVTIPSSTLTFLLPVAGLYLGLDLPGIVALIVLARFATLVTFIVLVVRMVPQLRKFSGSIELFSHLFAFGGWVTITSIVSPILVYLDRFLIGSSLTIAAVAYYTVPYEVVTRFTIIVGSLTVALFPAFSALDGAKDKEKIGTFFVRSLKYTLIASGPIVALMVVYAEDLLQIWMGNDFAIESTLVMQILVLGVLINSLAHMPFALLQGIGRPDLPAKFHLIELPIYILIAWILIGKFGIVGAASAWTLRVGLDAFLLFVTTFKIYRLSPSLLAENCTKPTVIWLLLFACIAYILKAVADPLSLVAQSLIFIVFLALFTWSAWDYVLDDIDRGFAHKIALWINS